jgi:hypothetical protein
LQIGRPTPLGELDDGIARAGHVIGQDGDAQRLFITGNGEHHTPL